MPEFIPHKYQEEPLELILNEDSFGLFMYPGSGKTALALKKIYQLKVPTLVVVPLDILYTTWLTENKKWSFANNLKIQVLHGPDKDANFQKKAGVYLINPEGIKWLLNKVKTTRRFPWKMLIVDESVKFKNPKSVRFKDLVKMLKTFTYRYILCGNPKPNHYLDLWAQLFILDQGKRLGSSWYQFRNRYFYPTDYKRFNWELKPEGKEEIVAAISDIVYFLDTADEIELPSRIINNIMINLPKKARETYDKMEKELFAEIDHDTNVLAANKTSALIKCWQIANGFLYETKEDETRVTHHIHDELITRTQTLVEELQGEPILIAYHFNEDLQRLKKAFPDARIVESGCKPSVTKAAERDWNNNKIEILIVYISKFSHGLNLQYGKGHNLLFYCLTYNHDTYDQLIRRFERQGAKFKEVVIHRLIVANTIHEAIIANLEHKEDETRDFLLALKDYRDSVKDKTF